MKINFLKMTSKLTSLLFICLAVCVTFHVSSAQEQGCPTLFVNLNNRCYLFSQEISLAKNWQDAHEYCNLYSVDTYVYDLLILDDDIQEPPLVSTHMKDNNETAALIGAFDLNLAVSTWSWVDEVPLSFQSSLWDCGYPQSTTNDNVGHYVQLEETYDKGTVRRFRLRNVPPATVDYFICEGPLLPNNLMHK